MNVLTPYAIKLRRLAVAVDRILRRNADAPASDPVSEQTHTGNASARWLGRIQMQIPIPFLARLDDIQLLTRMVTVGRVPLFLSLGTALIGLGTPAHVERIFVGAIGGLVSTAIWKLLAYPSFILMGTAFVASAARLERPFRWAACVLSGLAFDLLAGGLGVFIGILPALTAELGWRGFFGGLYLVAVAITGMGAMRLPARTIYGFNGPAMLERRALMVALGLFVAGAALAAAGTERWPELRAGRVHRGHAGMRGRSRPRRHGRPDLEQRPGCVVHCTAAMAPLLQMPRHLVAGHPQPLPRAHRRLGDVP
ncbi:hypothetical protein ACVWWJ_002672 [Luteibacter sp. HA06]